MYDCLLVYLKKKLTDFDVFTIVIMMLFQRLNGPAIGNLHSPVVEKQRQKRTRG